MAERLFEREVVEANIEFRRISGGEGRGIVAKRNRMSHFRWFIVRWPRLDYTRKDELQRGNEGRVWSRLPRMYLLS